MLNNPINFQEYADLWAKYKLNRTFRLAKIYFKRTERLKDKVFQHNWKDEAQNVEKLYYANKAVHHNANKNLPLTTLFLLGKLLSNHKYSKKTQKIINSNIISSEGLVFKLDDLEHQTKIRKALRTKNFSEVENKAA